MKIVLRWRLVASRRHLHARNAKATATILSPSAQYLSPVHGLALHNSPALDSLLGLAQDAGDETAPPASRLAHALFHRNTGDASEPLRPTRNRSLAAAHLCPRLQGEVLGLACRGAKLPEVREALEAAGVAALARETRVSIARFERLVSLTASAVEEDPPVGAAVFLAYVWARADGRACLLAFLDALARHRPGLFAPDSRPRCEEWRSEWVATAFGNDVNYLLGGGSVAVAPPPAELEALLGVGAAAATGEEGEEVEQEQELDAAALERLVYTLVARHGCAPEVRQESHGWRGQPAVADCVEACVREAVGLALWDRRDQRHDGARLPHRAEAAVRAFFCAAAPHGAPAVAAEAEAGVETAAAAGAAPGAVAGAGNTGGGTAGNTGGGTSGGTSGAGAAWYALLQARPRLRYMLGLERGLGYSYELHPSVDNFVATLRSLLDTPIAPPPPIVASPPASGGVGGSGGGGKRAAVVPAEAVPPWEGCELRWWIEGDARAPIVAMARAHAGGNGSAAAEAGAGGNGGGDGNGGAEQLRVVFNGERHCYALRNALASEPAWLTDVRRAWLGAWRAGRLPRGAVVAAARLLQTEDVLMPDR